jgi:hypothetical protein
MSNLRQRRFFLGLKRLERLACFAFMVWCAMVGPAAHAQLSTAHINGTVRDATGGIVPEARITLRSTETGVERTTVSNNAGNYSFVGIPPGNYTLAASRSGFSTTKIEVFTLQVNQTATFDFTISVSAVQQSVTIEATGVAVESSTAELGAVVQTQQVVDLPLNGRNFTQLLSLTPGVSPVSVAQNAGAGFGSSTTAGSSFSFPSINGQTNRSNFFMLDGINNQGNFLGTYGVPPIIDTIQEFKVQSHNDEAEFGQALGGIINLVSKSGTNEFHGTAWEFLRNDVLDARNTFLPDKTPFRENQFGIAGGGPVILPKYNGKNRTFFYAAYQGFRFRQPANSLYRVPTAAELGGDLSDDPRQIYNPFTTRPDPSNPGQFIRDPFPRNQIPASLLDPSMLLFAKTTLPAPNFSGVADRNAIDGSPFKQDENEWTVKVDQVISPRDFVWFRYSTSSNNQDGSGGRPELANVTEFPAKNYGVSYTHTFGASTVLQLEYGHVVLGDNFNTRFRNLPANFNEQLGFADTFAKDWYGFSGILIPDVNVNNFFSGGEQNSVSDELSSIHQGKANVSKVVGRHIFKWGGEMASNGWNALYNNAHVGFDSPQTSNPQNPAGSGSELASFLLGVPDNANRYNSHETMRFGGVMGFYFQDQWKATPKLTVNVGLRYDVTLRQPFGTPGVPGDEDRGLYTGNYDFSNGNYVLQYQPPFCSQAGHAPCIPGDSLPAHVVVSPNGKILHNNYDNWQPRIGLAYRLGEKTAIRASFGIFFDNWAGATQTSENYVGTWPDVGIEIANNLNNQLNVSPVPNTKATNPFPNGITGVFPAPDPFSQVTWFMDPYIKNPYSMQWNFGVQHQLTNSTVVNVNYVGSGSRRLDLGGYYNTALIPGPGDPQLRAPFPWAAPTYYDHSWGRSNYHALQVLLDKKFSNGLAYMVSYTWSKAINIGVDGWFGVEGQGVQNPYQFNNDRSVAGFDITHILSVNWLYELPVGPGKRLRAGNRALDFVIGNWQVNGIATFRSGIPFTLRVPGDLANTGGHNYLRPNYVGGDITLSNPTRQEWFNTAAFAVPAPFTYGNLGRNVMRADGVANFDISFFRDFGIMERMKLQFRAEMFNAFNTPVYGTPDRNILSSTFGQVTSIANTPRQIQMALKFVF